MPKQDYIDQHLDEAFNIQLDMPARRRTLRVSGLPYCPIIDTITPTDSEIGNLSGTLFTSMGTSCHEGIQLFMTLSPMGKDVWGSWKCRVCKKETKHCFRPKDCCNQPQKYEEVDFRVGPMTGHIDLVAAYNNRKHFTAYEFKTTGPIPKKPKRQHLLQVRTYVAMMKRNYGITIKSYVVVYIGRQFLERYKFGPYDATTSINQTEDWLYRAIRGYKAATIARKDPCRETLYDVVQNRPCKSEADWKSYMSRHYDFQKSTCPLLSKCTSGTKTCLKAVEGIVNG